jgi:hypothetical protein
MKLNDDLSEPSILLDKLSACVNTGDDPNYLRVG